jgi:hypothetical protein
VTTWVEREEMRDMSPSAAKNAERQISPKAARSRGDASSGGQCRMAVARGKFARATTPSDRQPIPSYGHPTSKSALSLALVSKADRGPVGLDQTAVSVSRLVLGTRIDAEFLSDMGELFRVHETAVCHHRAQGR